MATKVMYIDSFRILFYFIFLFLSTYYLHEIVGSFLTVIKKKSSKCSKTYEADGSLINLIMNHILLFNSNTTAVFLPLSPLRHVALTSVSVKYVPTISSG